MQDNNTDHDSIKSTNSRDSLRTTEKQADIYRFGDSQRVMWPCRYCDRDFFSREQRNGHEASCKPSAETGTEGER